MGVPKFFRYISERYPCLSELVRENQVPEFDNLYLDMNGIIHNCSHPNDNDIHFRITEEQIFKDIFFYLETLFNMIQPQKLFFLAVDGVAPRAKMNQQRGRRFRSAKEAEVQEEKARQKGEVLPSEARFDSNCITPGTPFMCRLNDALRYFIQHKISTSKAWRNCKVILSGHETVGEGEHKIMEYIRYLKTQKSYDPNTRHCLYGLDADLVMLGLCTHERHFSLLREEVKFGKKNNKAVSVSQQRFFLLHLSLMREYLEQEFITLKGNMKIPFDIEKIIDDWVLMGFLVGNDFIPNIPNLHINSNALPMLYQAYIKTMTNLDGYINEGGFLNLSRLQVYIANLEQFDRDHFTSTYDDLKFLESKHQGAFNQRNDDTFGGNQELMDMVKATEFEFDIDLEEDVDSDDSADDDDDKNFEKEFHQHRRDYYVNKMKYEEMTPEVLAEQAECYIRALQWTLSYYYHGVQSWSWYYPHHYAPFISDLKNFKDFDIRFEMGEPFLPFQQLMSVLPAASRAHVPRCYQPLMTNPESELINFYPTNFETDLNGKKQDWEAVVLIPFIEEKLLLKTLEKHNTELSVEEKARNVHGPMYIYTYSSTSQGMLQAPLSFQSIGNLMCEEKKVFREEIQVPKDKLILGPSKGAMLNVYFTGFPTFKHLEYRSEFKTKHVKVFDQPSRGDNMIIMVESEDVFEKTLEDVAKELILKTVYVGWPHLVEAKIVRVSDSVSTIGENLVAGKTDPQRWRHDTQAIKDHHMNRMGIDVGELNRIVHFVQATGEEYKFDVEAKIFRLEKTYSKLEIAYPIQCIVQNITAYRKKFKPEVPLTEAFKIKTEIFMLASSYYGAFGEVVDVNCFEKTGRVKVALTVPEEPDFSSVVTVHEITQGSYMAPYDAAAKLSITDNVLNRITGTVLVIPGNKREVSKDGQQKLNIGLQLKFPKLNEEVAGYTKKERFWLYSEKVINLVQEYYCKFPVVFEVLGKRSGNGNDIYFESDFFNTTHGDSNLQTLIKWLAQLPHHKAERRQIGTESVEKEVLDKISETVNFTKEAPKKRVTMQAKPHLLFAPALSQTTAQAPDPKADYQLFDRVIIAKESEKFSVGTKGTVIGINRVKDLNPVRQECINKEDIYCEILFDYPVDGTETGRVAIENLINISYGKQLSSNVTSDVNNTKTRYAETKKTVKPEMNWRSTGRGDQLRENNVSYSMILKKPEANLDLGKKQNFSDMWNALKTDINPVPSAPKVENLSSTLTNLHVSSHEVPVIKAPSAPPLPPAEWLQKVERKLKLETPNQPPPPFFPNKSYNSGNTLGSNNHFKSGVYFPSNSNGGNMKPMSMPPMHQQQQRFFNNNSFNGMNNYNNQSHRYRQPFNQQRPSQMQPHLQNQASPSGPNPFIPLQASRKATKGKGNHSESKKLPQQEQSENVQQSKIKNFVEKKPEISQPEKTASTSSSQPVVDNRKCRLAISFGK